jgi:hypothetical protein
MSNPRGSYPERDFKRQQTKRQQKNLKKKGSRQKDYGSMESVCLRGFGMEECFSFNSF